MTPLPALVFLIVMQGTAEGGRQFHWPLLAVVFAIVMQALLAVVTVVGIMHPEKIVRRFAPRRANARRLEFVFRTACAIYLVGLVIELADFAVTR
jgi:hypothetical protein